MKTKVQLYIYICVGKKLHWNSDGRRFHQQCHCQVQTTLTGNFFDIKCWWKWKSHTALEDRWSVSPPHSHTNNGNIDNMKLGILINKCSEKEEEKKFPSDTS